MRVYGEASGCLFEGTLKIARLMTRPGDEERPLSAFSCLGSSEGFNVISPLHVATDISVRTLHEEQSGQEKSLHSPPPRLEKDSLWRASIGAY